MDTNALIDRAEFQSTLPVGGATSVLGVLHTAADDFNPRSPWGERRYIVVMEVISILISIHAPRGGSDSLPLLSLAIVPISIHAPRGGSDEHRRRLQSSPEDFNPRSPWGERPGRS